MDSAGRSAVVERARTLAARSRAPLYHLDRHRTRLHQRMREIRAAARRGAATRAEYQRRIAASVIERKRQAALAAVGAARADGLRDATAALERAQRALAERRAEKLAAHGAALRAHDPQRTLERGYALLIDESGEPLLTAAAAREAKTFDAKLADGTVRARVTATHLQEEEDTDGR
jgi:exodeoxyribonuclease VII large subunit